MSNSLTPQLPRLKQLLLEVLKDTPNRAGLIKEFQLSIWNLQNAEPDAPEFVILSELALDLDYYEPDPVIRRETSEYYDEERLKREITNSLEKLAKLDA